MSDIWSTSSTIAKASLIDVDVDVTSSFDVTFETALGKVVSSSVTFASMKEKFEPKTIFYFHL